MLIAAWLHQSVAEALLLESMQTDVHFSLLDVVQRFSEGGITVKSTVKHPAGVVLELELPHSLEANPRLLGRLAFVQMSCDAHFLLF